MAVWFLLGMSLGMSLMWLYFQKAGLIRTREEYERALLDGDGK